MQAYEVRDDEAAGSEVGRRLQGWEEHLIEAGAPLWKNILSYLCPKGLRDLFNLIFVVLAFH